MMGFLQKILNIEKLIEVHDYCVTPWIKRPLGLLFLLRPQISILPAWQKDHDVFIAYNVCRLQAYALECRCYQVDINHLESCTGLTSLHLSDMSTCLRLTTDLGVLHKLSCLEYLLVQHCYGLSLHDLGCLRSLSKLTYLNLGNISVRLLCIPV